MQLSDYYIQHDDSGYLRFNNPAFESLEFFLNYFAFRKDTLASYLIELDQLKQPYSAIPGNDQMKLSKTVAPIIDDNWRNFRKCEPQLNIDISTSSSKLKLSAGLSSMSTALYFDLDEFIDILEQWNLLKQRQTDETQLAIQKLTTTGYIDLLSGYQKWVAGGLGEALLTIRNSSGQVLKQALMWTDSFDTVFMRNVNVNELDPGSFLYKYIHSRNLGNDWAVDSEEEFNSAREFYDRLKSQRWLILDCDYANYAVIMEMLRFVVEGGHTLFIKADNY